jgi:hypothetical protein
MAYTGSLPAGYTRGTYNQDFQIFDDETDEGLDLTDAVITFEIRRPGCTSAELSATNTNGSIVITDSDEGQFELTLTVTQMRTLCPMQYEVGITITQNGETTQFFAGTIPIIDGIVA